MALTTKHRIEIYQGLTPVIGEEAVEAMLAQFPARDADEPVTRGYLDMRLAEFERRTDARLEGRFDTIEQRFDTIEQRFAAIDRRFSAIDVSFAGIDVKFAELDRSIEERLHRQTIRMGALLASISLVGIALATYLTSLAS